MRIAIDLDGVVINLIDVWLKRLGVKTGQTYSREQVTHFDFGNCIGLPMDTTYQSLTPDIYEECTPEPGAEKYLPLLDAMVISPLVVVSKVSGSKHKQGFETAKTEWLKRYFPGIRFEFRYVRSGEAKHPHVADCDLFIDDYEDNFKDVTCECILFDQPWNRHEHRFQRAFGWPKVIEIVASHQASLG